MSYIAAPGFGRAECETLAQAYVEGAACQNRVALSVSFTSDAHVQGIDEGRWIAVPVADWIDFICAPERQGQADPDYRIRRLQIEADTAAIWLETRFGSFDYIDMLSICLTPDGAKICGKLFTQYRRESG